MRIAAYVADSQALTSAGVRIRYDRLRPRLAAMGHHLDVRRIDDVDGAAPPDIDAAIVTKVYDGRAIALARRLREAGVRIGIDVFDDYYSQGENADFTHIRGWLAQIAGHLDFALCATPPMQRRLEALLPGCPAHVINDPHDDVDLDDVAAAAEDAAARARRDRTIDIAWFGIGDNRDFQVGLEDLAAFGSRLAVFARAGWTARLRVLTNPRAMTTDRLEGLARLPVPWEIEEWSESRQAGLLATSLVSFLPVNGQRFSTVKSMNRVLTALLGGTQVLSAGYPLYAAFDALIYRDAGRIVDDLTNDRLRLRREAVAELGRLLSGTGDPGTEAARLADFLTQVSATDRPADPRPLLIVQGYRSPGALSAAANRHRALSVNHPFLGQDGSKCDVALGIDASGRVAVDMTPAAWERLRPAVAEGTAQDTAAAPRRRRLLVPGDHVPRAIRPRSVARPGLLDATVGYAPGLDLIGLVAEYLFGDCDIVVSDKAAPFPSPRLPRATTGPASHVPADAAP